MPDPFQELLETFRDKAQEADRKAAKTKEMLQSIRFDAALEVWREAAMLLENAIDESHE